MTDSTTDTSAALWSELLLRSMAELRELFAALGEQLEQASADDFSHLFEGAANCQALAEP